MLQSWRLLYKDGAEWKPVAATDYGVKRDQFNPESVRGQPRHLHSVTTTAEPRKLSGLRLEVQLQPKFSGGILEWRMRE